MKGFRRALAAALATVALAASTPALAVGLRGFQGLPAEEFEESDIALLRAAIRDVVQKPEGTTVTWVNPDTGNRGQVTHLKSGTRDGRSCRLLEMNTTANSGQHNVLRLPLCQQPDNSWKFE